MVATLHSDWPKCYCVHVEVCVELAEQRDEEQRKDTSSIHPFSPFYRLLTLILTSSDCKNNLDHQKKAVSPVSFIKQPINRGLESHTKAAFNAKSKAATGAARVVRQQDSS